MQDKDLLIEEHLDKLNLLTNENNILKQSQHMLQVKLDHIYENNILIAKEGKENQEDKEKEAERKDKNDFVDNVTDEIRKLHFQLK